MLEHVTAVAVPLDDGGRHGLGLLPGGMGGTVGSVRMSITNGRSAASARRHAASTWSGLTTRTRSSPTDRSLRAADMSPSRIISVSAYLR
ncbi:hypothetical protein [Streptomyces halstedii]|uniref:hypothetical protein n=1 Tax=Streptomyces halstedii TaxID=1944 RepID=UPI0036898EDB